MQRLFLLAPRAGAFALRYLYLLLAVLLAFVFLLSDAACVSKPVDDVGKAREITQYRRKARDALQTYIASDGRDLASLEDAVEYERITTEISPSTCASCFREYGYSLSFLGHHYRVLSQDVVEEANQASSLEERNALLDEAEDYRQEMRRYLQAANNAYRAYFIAPGVPVHPYDYERVMRHYELLEDYRAGLYYLDRFVAAYGEMDELTKEKVDKLRRYYRSQNLLEREKTYRGIGGGGEAEREDSWLRGGPRRRP